MQQKVLRNRLLEVLPPASRERLLAASTHVDLPIGAEMFRRGERPQFLYFLTSGVTSVIFISEGGTSVELSTQGAEGLIGWSNLFGPAALQADCSVQVGGAGYRLPIGIVQREFDEVTETRQRVLEYAQHQTIFSNQVVACNRLHRAEARFARWLLGVADRIGGDDILMTQEFMSTMLGTRRTTVAEVCGDLSRAGATESRRGGLRIVNRTALEGFACECYGILRERFDALYRAPVRGIEAPGRSVSFRPPAVR